MFTVLVMFAWLVGMKITDLAQSFKQKAADSGWHWWPAEEEETDETEKGTQTEGDWWSAALQPQPAGI